MSVSQGSYCRCVSFYSTPQDLVQELEQYPQIQTCLAEAKKALRELSLPPVEVRFTASSHAAKVEQDGHLITIRADLPPAEQRTMYVWGLLNIANRPKIEDIHKKINTYDSPVVYVNDKQRVKFAAIKTLIEITNQMDDYFKNTWANVDNLTYDQYCKKTSPEEDRYLSEWRAANPPKEKTCKDVCKTAVKTVAFIVAVIAPIALSLLIGDYHAKYIEGTS